MGYGLGLNVGDGGVGEADDIGRGDPLQQRSVTAASPGHRKTEGGSIDDHRERGLMTYRGNSPSRMTGDPADGIGGGEHESTETGGDRQFPTVNPDRTGGDRREVGPVVSLEDQRLQDRRLGDAERGRRRRHGRHRHAGGDKLVIDHGSLQESLQALRR